MGKQLNLLTIGYAKRALQERSREQLRMRAYADVLTEYTMIILTRKKDNLPSFYKVGNLTIYGTNAHTRIGMLYYAYRIGKQMLKETEDKQWTISSQDPFETSAVGRTLSRAPNTVHHIQMHGDPFSGTVWRNESLLNRIRFVYGLFTLRRAEGIRVVSERARKGIVDRGVSGDKITVVPIVLDMSIFLEVGAVRTYQRKKTCTFLFVGRLSKEKNVERILKVFAVAYKQNVSIRLRIVGEGPCLQSLKTKVQLLHIGSAVDFAPWTNSVAEEMSKVDVFIFASSHEGYGMVLQEAMATGLPCISTDVGCVSDMLVHERDGLVVSKKDDTEYVNAINILAKNYSLRTRLGRSAHRTVKTNLLSDEKYIDKWKNSFVFR